MKTKQIGSQIIFILAFVVCQISSLQVPQYCLDCICHASSGCNQRLRCHNSGPNAYFCGPYQISWAYWADGGKPGSSNHPQDFENCLTNKRCAEQAINGYMTKWATDCNNDGIVDCYDFAAIHKTGASGCKNQWLYESEYWNKIRKCLINSNSFDSVPVRKPLRPNARPQNVRPQDRPISRPVERPVEEVPFTRPQERPITRPQERPVIRPQDRPISRPVERPEESPVIRPFERPQERPITRPFERPQERPITRPVERPQERPIIGPFERPEESPIIRPFERPQERPYENPGVIIPGRAPINPVNWGTTRQPLNTNHPTPVRPPPNEDFSSFGQPYKPSTVTQPPYDSSVIPVKPIAPVEAPINAPVDVPENIPVNPPDESSIFKPISRVTISGSPLNGLVDVNCLECLCQASTDCDLKKKCEGNYCGPYLISWGYWADGGKLGGDYAICANDKQCAEKTVQGYMSKWKKDCNKDGVIDCADYAAIHKLGPYNCDATALLGTNYWNLFEQCSKPSIDARSGAIVSDSPWIRGSEVFSTENPLPTSSEIPFVPHVPTTVSETPINSFNNQHLPVSNFPIESDLNKPTKPTLPTNSDYTNYNPTTPTPTDNAPISENPDTFNLQPFSRNAIPNRETDVNDKPVTRSANDNSDKSNNNSTVTRECMECICHASSKCNLNIGCVNNGAGSTLCGPYQINWAYWSDAGQPGDSFENCMLDKQCSESVLETHINKWGKDCNGDGTLDCYDIASVFRAGQENCNAEWFLDSQYWNDFRECYDF